MLVLLKLELISSDADLQHHTGRAHRGAGNTRKPGEI